MGWLVSRYSRDMQIAIKEMKRSGMEKQLPLIHLPQIPGSSQELQSSFKNCLDAANELIELQNLVGSEKTVIAEGFLKYAMTLGACARKLAEHAGSIDQSLANADATDMLAEIDNAIFTAKSKPELKHAVQFAELARISMVSSMVMALSGYAINNPTAADRVTALQATEKQVEKCAQFKQEYGV